MRTMHWVRLSGIVLVLAGLAAACGGQSATTRAEAEAVLEELPTGQAAEWYWARFREFGFQIETVEYVGDDSVRYEVVRDGQAYAVRLQLDPETETASRVEVVELAAAAAEPEGPGEAEDAPAAEPGTTPEPEAPVRREAPRSPAATDTAPAEPPRERARAAPALRLVTLPSGTLIPASLNDYLNSGSSRPGQSFTMTVTEPVWAEGAVAVPAGSMVRGTVAHVESARRPNKGGRLVLKATAVELGGTEVRFEGIVTAEGAALEGDDSIREDLKEIAIGAGIGGVLGGILKGGKGALAGIIIGGGGTFAATKGQQVELPPDTELLVEVRQTIQVPAQ